MDRVGEMLKGAAAMRDEGRIRIVDATSGGTAVDTDTAYRADPVVIDDGAIPVLVECDVPRRTRRGTRSPGL